VIVVDTGPLVALVNRRDTDHAVCQDWYRSTDPRSLMVPGTVVAEACFLIEKYCGPAVEADFLDDLANGSYGTVIGLSSADLHRMSDLVRQYASLPLGGTDASVIAVAERFGLTQVCTIDRRHFHVVRPRHLPAFELLPAKL
jgi:predicted nucleic acid-binding protein